MIASSPLAAGVVGSGAGGAVGSVGVGLSVWSRTKPIDVGERRVVAEFEVVVAGDVVGLADAGEDFGLLDGVDAEVGFEVEFGVEQVGGVAGLLGDDLQHARGDRVLAARRGRLRLGCRRRSRSRHRRRRGHDRDRGGSRLGRGRGGGARGCPRAAVDDAQAVLDDLELRGVVAADLRKPRRPRGRIRHAVGVAELLGVAPAAVGDGRPAQQHHRDLRAEPGREPQRVADRVGAALRQVERSERGIHVAEVRDGRDEPGLERFHRDDVLDADAHRVPGVALRVRDDDVVGGLAEDPAQRVDLRRGAPAAGRRVGLVRDEHGLGGDHAARDAARLGLGDDLLHHLADVLDVEPRAVERAVRGDRAEHLADRRDPALAGGARRLDDERGGAHPEQHAVAALVERERSLLDDLVGGRGPGGEEARADPRQHLVGGRVVGGDHDHPRATARADPVLGEGDRLRRARARRVDLRVRAAGADELGELRVPHREDAEQEAPVERVLVLGELEPQVVDPALDLDARDRVALRDAREDLLELAQLLAPGAVAPEPVELVGELVVARERRAEHDPGVVAQRRGQGPAVRELRAGGRRLVVLDERDARVAQRVDARADRELRRAAERREPPGVDAEVVLEVHLPGARRELDDVGDVVDRLEVRLAVLALHEAGDVAVGDLVAHARRG